MNRPPILAVLLLSLSVVQLCAAEDGGFGSRALLAKPKCIKTDRECSLYFTCTEPYCTKKCCGATSLCTMGRDCTATALSTQLCTPTCKKRAPAEGKWVTFGNNLTGWEAGKKNLPAVLVLQEWWGVNEAIQETAEHLAQQGYRTLIPDLYKGKVALDAMEAMHLSSGLNWTMAIDEMTQAVKYLKDTGSEQVAATGFCQGGALSICAAQFTDIVAAAPFYGLPNRTFCQLENVTKPIHLHFGGNDRSFPPSRYQPAFDALKSNGSSPDAQLWVYPNMPHAFMNGLTPAGRAKLGGNVTALPDEAQVTLAFSRLTAFLAQYLQGRK